MNPRLSSKHITRAIPRLPVALSIAGSDSGGGAGIQADLKTFAALDVHGATAITCLTAQNPRGVLGVHACPPKMLGLQLEAVFAELRPDAAKTGMLYSSRLIETVCDFLQEKRFTKLVADPVMVATSGAVLLKPDALRMIKKRLLPLCCLITPNLDEAALLTGKPLSDVEGMRAAAKSLHFTYGCAVLVKGGHLRGLGEAVDVFYDKDQELLLSAPFAKGVSTHGTGCTYSAALAALLAKGHDLPRSVQMAKEFITNAIHASRSASGHPVLHSFWKFS